MAADRESLVVDLDTAITMAGEIKVLTTCGTINDQELITFIQHRLG